MLSEKGRSGRAQMGLAPHGTTSILNEKAPPLFLPIPCRLLGWPLAA
jgi:hypothetical protein